MRGSSEGGIRERLIAFFFTANGILTIVILMGIFFFLAYIGIQAFFEIPITEFFGMNWNPGAYTNPSWGILPLLAGTIYVAVLSLAIAIPLGVASAIYIAELASPTLREILKPAVEMIASIPSVVLGLIGLIILAPLVADLFNLPNGLNAFTASILVAIMALPTIISISEDVIGSIPDSYREASLALGATKWQTIRSAILPAASGGIVAASMLGLGRVVGETMVVLMVAGNSRAFPTSIFDPVRPITSTIAIEIKEVVQGDLHFQALFALGLILFLMTFAINLASDIFLARRQIR
ncbi:MAG: phosphate ABC transporter permease [Candidatus Syntrophoarchaeum caldarius]|uniref:Phosphate transport system permease protein n=1 Tax=Candidatus Syntropharchaeum caldarium TaxID=1838285 RepID=A0A1F2PCX1_9EURY|nr:MAG: phosphate ABC transporter permease [Candidatus Syntrophoarchaeum caldarius]